MSFDGIKVQHGRMDTGAADVMKAATDIRDRLNVLEGDLKPLATDWTGSAREAYRVAQENWDKAMDSMILLLQQASQGVSTSNEEYMAADKRGAARF